MSSSGLARFLIHEGLLSENDCQMIARDHSNTGAAFAKVVVALGVLSEEGLAKFLAEKTRLPQLPHRRACEGSPEALAAVSAPLLRSLEVVPLNLSGHTLTVAMADPLDQDTLQQLAFFTPYKIKPVIATFTSIYMALDRLFQNFKPQKTALEALISQHSAPPRAAAPAVSSSPTAMPWPETVPPRPAASLAKQPVASSKGAGAPENGQDPDFPLDAGEQSRMANLDLDHLEEGEDLPSVDEGSLLASDVDEGGAPAARDDDIELDENAVYDDRGVAVPRQEAQATASQSSDDDIDDNTAFDDSGLVDDLEAISGKPKVAASPAVQAAPATPTLLQSANDSEDHGLWPDDEQEVVVGDSMSSGAPDLLAGLSAGGDDAALTGGDADDMLATGEEREDGEAPLPAEDEFGELPGGASLQADSNGDGLDDLLGVDESALPVPGEGTQVQAADDDEFGGLSDLAAGGDEELAALQAASEEVMQESEPSGEDGLDLMSEEGGTDLQAHGRPGVSELLIEDDDELLGLNNGGTDEAVSELVGSAADGDDGEDGGVGSSDLRMDDDDLLSGGAQATPGPAGSLLQQEKTAAASKHKRQVEALTPTQADVMIDEETQASHLADDLAPDRGNALLEDSIDAASAALVASDISGGVLETTPSYNPQMAVAALNHALAATALAFDLKKASATAKNGLVKAGFQDGLLYWSKGDESHLLLAWQEGSQKAALAPTLAKPLIGALAGECQARTWQAIPAHAEALAGFTTSDERGLMYVAPLADEAFALALVSCLQTVVEQPPVLSTGGQLLEQLARKLGSQH